MSISFYKDLYKNKNGAFYSLLHSTKNDIKEMEKVMWDDEKSFSQGEYHLLKEDNRKLQLILYYNMSFEKQCNYRRKIKMEKQELHCLSHGYIDADKEYYKEFYDSDYSDDEWEYDDDTLINNINKYNGY